MSEDEIVKVFKDQLNTVVRRYDYDPERAKFQQEEKSKVMNQNKTDKEILENACKENFKQALMLAIHLKVYIVVIDSSLRYGGTDNFTLTVNFFEPNKKARLIKKLI